MQLAEYGVRKNNSLEDLNRSVSLYSAYFNLLLLSFLPENIKFNLLNLTEEFIAIAQQVKLQIWIEKMLQKMQLDLNLSYSSQSLQLRVTHYTYVDTENFSLNIMVVMSIRMRSVGHVAYMGEREMRMGF
jgi:hypothetical protein